MKCHIFCRISECKTVFTIKDIGELLKQKGNKRKAESKGDGETNRYALQVEEQNMLKESEKSS